MQKSDKLSDAERRQAPRHGFEAEVRLEGDEPWSGRFNTANISTTGAFIVTERPPPRGKVVKLELNVDENLSLPDLEALVVHVRAEASEPSARGCGVMFLKLSPDQNATLSRFVS